MSHKVIIKALEYVSTETSSTYDKHWQRLPTNRDGKAHRMISLLTSQRRFFNSLAPILPTQRDLFPNRIENFFRLLMRADTFRFATSLCVISNAALIQEVLSKMDFVIDVTIDVTVFREGLTSLLMTLPHLERVVFASAYYCRFGTSYQGTLRRLIKHPRESVRRSVAVTTSSRWFEPLSNEQLISAVRDDIIPLIDSASCNAAICDYLHLAEASSQRWTQLPRDIIMMLGDRLFQYFTAANSHCKLVHKSLELLGKLAAISIRPNTGNPQTPTFHVVVDVFKEWPVLELLPDMIRCGVVSCDGTGVRSVVTKGIFPMFNPYSEASVAETRKLVQHHKQRFFDLQIPDIIYDSCFAKAGESPFARCSIFESIAYVDSLSLLNKTHVLQKELRNFLLPWHREVMAELFRFKRQNARILGHYGELLLDFDKNEFDRRTAGARFIVNLVLAPFQMKQRAADENSQIIRVLFDEHEGLNIGPILRSYLLVARTALNRTASIEGWLYHCRANAVAEHNECIERGRRSREDDGEDGTTSRCYLTEFLESLEVH